MNSTLIYVHDPMCSWCWGFEKIRQQLFASLKGQINIRSLVGGLAIDSNEAMPKEMLPVVDKPIIQYAVEEALAAGIEQIIFVTGSGKGALEDHFDSCKQLIGIEWLDDVIICACFDAANTVVNLTLTC